MRPIDNARQRRSAELCRRGLECGRARGGGRRGGFSITLENPGSEEPLRAVLTFPGGVGGGGGRWLGRCRAGANELAVAVASASPSVALLCVAERGMTWTALSLVPAPLYAQELSLCLSFSLDVILLLSFSAVL
jgi:hypothetical protein